jgi:excisionase family DNA binding protein
MDQEFENSFSISQVARILAVDSRTVRKWLAVEDSRGAAIPRSGWYRLPGGQIRIKRSAVKKLQSEG